MHFQQTRCCCMQTIIGFLAARLNAYMHIKHSRSLSLWQMAPLIYSLVYSETLSIWFRSKSQFFSFMVSLCVSLGCYGILSGSNISHDSLTKSYFANYFFQALYFNIDRPFLQQGKHIPSPFLLQLISFLPHSAQQPDIYTMTPSVISISPQGSTVCSLVISSFRKSKWQMQKSHWQSQQSSWIDVLLWQMLHVANQGVGQGFPDLQGLQEKHWPWWREHGKSCSQNGENGLPHQPHKPYISFQNLTITLQVNLVRKSYAGAAIFKNPLQFIKIVILFTNVDQLKTRFAQYKSLKLCRRPENNKSLFRYWLI